MKAKNQPRKSLGLSWKIRRRTLGALSAGCLMVWAASASAELSEQVLKSFGNPAQSGRQPVGVLVGADGLLYGTTSGGGIYGRGTVFRASVDGSQYTVVHAFGANAADGAAPQAGLTQGRDGSLYGTTTLGGTNQSGVVFKLATDSSGYSILHTCGNYHLDGDGNSPSALIQGGDNRLYGLAQEGGAHNGGAVFRLQTDGSAYQIVYSFGGQFSPNSLNEDGLTPVALTQGGDGRLYGTTKSGGTNGFNNDFGVVFKLETDGSGFAVLHTFGDSAEDGTKPVGLAQGKDGRLVGVTQSGGSSGGGVVFRLSTDGSGYALGHQFTGVLGDGSSPGAGLILGADGAWYGSTVEGGADDGANGFGVVFRMNADGTGYQVIRRFNFVDSIFYATFSTDGQEPGLLAQGADGTLYGCTTFGGTTGQGLYRETGAGTLFALATNGTSYTVIHNFSATGSDGGSPAGGLSLGLDQALYGVTSAGGPAGQGTVFKININGGGYRVLYGFGLEPIDGLNPQGGLMLGADGQFYGTTPTGGYAGGNGAGLIFKVSPAGGHYTGVLSFGFFGAIGQAPTSAPLQGQDGNLFGVTSAGGYSVPGRGGLGIVYAVGTNGLGFTVLHQFSTNYLEGNGPVGGLIQGSDGTLYGTTYGYGLIGTKQAGTVFSLLPNGTGFQVLHTFGNNSTDGGNPSAALIRGADGFLFGTTESGGAYGNGTVYKLSLSGLGYEVIHHFGSVTNDGQVPKGPVTLGGDGFLYGTTFYGGAYGPPVAGHRGFGVAFKLDTVGSSYSVLYQFGSKPNDGHLPLGGLLHGPDGAFYGTTSSGGEDDAGTVFRLGSTLFKFASIRQLSDKTIDLALSGPAPTSCRIEVSTDLLNWITLTNLVNATGTLEFIDVSAASSSQRFYRAFQSP